MYIVYTPKIELKLKVLKDLKFRILIRNTDFKFTIQISSSEYGSYVQNTDFEIRPLISSSDF